MKAKREIPVICEAIFGRLPERAMWAWTAIADLERRHKASAVVMDFKNWAEENAGDDFPKGILKAYLDVASDRLSATTSPVVVAAKDPEAVKVTREITYLSGGEVSFSDKHRVRISELLREYTTEEIIGAWKEWAQNQDSEPKYLAGKFVQAADDVCYAARRKAQERAQEAQVREEAARRLQEAAEAERRAQEAQQQEEFDPLASL